MHDSWIFISMAGIAGSGLVFLQLGWIFEKMGWDFMCEILLWAYRIICIGYIITLTIYLITRSIN